MMNPNLEFFSLKKKQKKFSFRIFDIFSWWIESDYYVRELEKVALLK